MASDHPSERKGTKDEETAVPSKDDAGAVNDPVVADPFELLLGWFPRLGRFGDRGWSSLWEDPFRNFEEDLKAQRQSFEQLRRWARESASAEGGPYVWGYTMRVGPDGVPRVEHFGNRPASPNRITTRTKVADATNAPDASTREPLTDLVEREGSVVVTLELPGVAKEDIGLQLHDGALEIDVERGPRRYHKRLRLPTGVDIGSAKASYHNGVLDVTLPKAAHSKGKRLEIS